ncbi:MAG: hypothetical protein M1438_17015 [Deltaproteobacteria bacterium]|nr:hypothetical protein [Deltaproteobacteria bacterium]
MKTYHNNKWGFTITLPKGWREPPWLVRVLFRRRQLAEQPEFYGPYHSKLQFTINSIRLVPEIVEQQKNLERMAVKCGHLVTDFDVIRVQGRDHATMVFDARGIGEVKVYSLIFGHTEYLITGHGRVHETDYIVKSFRV